jgi:hypothetical protein
VRASRCVRTEVSWLETSFLPRPGYQNPSCVLALNGGPSLVTVYRGSLWADRPTSGRFPALNAVSGRTAALGIQPPCTLRTTRFRGVLVDNDLLNVAVGSAPGNQLGQIVKVADARRPPRVLGDGLTA